MQISKASKYDKKFVEENMMGPNSMVVLEELLENIKLDKSMRVLDLGCGRGLTSVFLAKEYGVNVYAVDLWIPATENYQRFKQMGLDDLIVPIHSDAKELPFADEYFDAIISVDSYHYFGNNKEFFNKYIRRFLKKDAIVALAFPGMKKEVLPNVPEEMKEYWEEEALNMWHSIDWWKNITPDTLKEVKYKELECFDKAWEDWLTTENPYAIEDRAMMKADNGRFMNLISMTGKIK